MDLSNLTLEELLERIKATDTIEEIKTEPAPHAIVGDSVSQPEEAEEMPGIYEPRQHGYIGAEADGNEPAVQASVQETLFYTPDKPEVQHLSLSEEPEAAVFQPDIPENNQPIEIIEDDTEFFEEQRPELEKKTSEPTADSFISEAYVPEIPAMSEPEPKPEPESEPVAETAEGQFTPEIITKADKAQTDDNSMFEEFQFDFGDLPEELQIPLSIEVPEAPANPGELTREEKFAIFGNIDIDSDVGALFGEKPIAPSVSADVSDNAAAPTDTQKTQIFTKAEEKPAVFERPGIVTGKSMFDNTADLRAVPAILTADEVLKEKQADEQKTFIRTGSIPIVAQSSSQPVRHEDSQMVLPGFDSEPEPVEQVDESIVEDELRRNRSKLVDGFRLQGIVHDEPAEEPEEYDEIGGEIKEKQKRFSLTKTRTRLNRQEIEYNKPGDRGKVAGFIARKKLTAFIGTVVSAILTLALIIINCIPALSESILLASAEFSVLAAVSFALLGICFAATLPCCLSGITCFFNGSGKPNSSTPVFLAAVIALIEALLLIFLDAEGEIVIFAPAAAFILCLCAAGKLFTYSRVQSNFEFMAGIGKEKLHTVGTIDNEIDAGKIGRNVVMGDADIRYSAKTGFISNYLAYSLASDAADDLCIRLVPITAAASLVIGVIAAIVSKNILCGLSIFTGAMCMGAPASAAIVANLPLSRANKKLREDGGIISGYAGAFEYESTNAIAVDAADLFPGSCCNIHGMKTFYGMRIDDAILTAASMLIEAGGPISSLFDEVVMGRKELLMNVEELIYEDRLGLSGWIRGRRVFVGNRKLLENHNIEIPMSVDEAKYRHDGRRVIYLADAGKIAAIFVVSYGSHSGIAEHLRKTENNGINILIRTTDSNITEEFVANTFHLPLNSVKIVSTNAGEVLKAYSDKPMPKADAKLIHNGSAAAFLHCVSKASSLCSIAGIITTQQTFCCAAGLLLMAIMVIFSGALNVTALQICICQLLWLGIGAVVPLINRD